MTKKVNTKRALLLSALSLLLCVSMLIGSTFAWFTDSVVSGNNQIVAGNLDVVLEYKNAWDDEWTAVDQNTKIFKEGALYEPGYTEVVFLRASNAGSLALKYNLMVNIASEKPGTNVNGEEFKLSDYLEIGTYSQDEYSSGFNYADILMPYMFGTREAALSNVTLAKLATAESIVKTDAPLLAGEQTAQVIAIVLTMPETVGNEANHNGVNAPEINLGVSLVATQYTHEMDSFGNDYDKDAEYPTIAVNVASADDLNAALTSDAGMPIALTCDIDGFSGKVEKAAQIDLGGNTLYSRGISVKDDLELTGGKVTINNYSGYLDIRPTDDSVFTFKNVDFTNTYKTKPGNIGTDYIENIAKLVPMEAGIKTTIVFENCKFVNTRFEANGLSGKNSEIDITFKNCTFDLLGHENAIYIGNYFSGIVNIDNCTFNYQGTSNNKSVLSVSNSSSTTVTVNATNNKLHAVAATPYTYDPDKGETIVDTIKVDYYGAKNYCFFDYRYLSGGYSTVNETGTVISGAIATESRR